MSRVCENDVGYVDSLLYSSLLSDSELACHRVFGATDVVIAPVLPRVHRLQTTREFVAFYLQFLNKEVPRARAAGLNAFASLALNVDTRPYRAHYDAWNAMEQLIQTHPEIVAVGPFHLVDLTKQTFTYLNHHVKLAQVTSLPLVISMPTQLNVTSTVECVDWLKPRVGHTPVVFKRLHLTMLDYVLDAGFMVSLSTDAPNYNMLLLEERLGQILEQHPDYHDRIILMSSIDQTCRDLFGIPRLLDGLSRHTLLFEDGRIARRNARNLFKLPDEPMSESEAQGVPYQQMRKSPNEEN